ncbi:MAG: hypothetical protein WCX82_01545 [archaeon]|jgi:hypothetical protein
MQTKIIDFENKTKANEINSKLKYLFIGIFIILISIFATRTVFAEANVDNIDLTFEKETYSLMEDTSIRIGFTIENNNPETVRILVWADCEDGDNEISCNYSNNYTMSGNSTQTGSLYLTGIDQSNSTLSVYIKLLNSDTQEINEFTTDIEVNQDEEDGDFQVDVYDYSLCIGRNNKITMEIENDYQDGLFYLYLSNSRLQINSEYSNPVYFRDNKEIDYYIVVPENVEQGDTFDLQMRIENEEIKVVKEITLYATDCPDTDIDFTVSGPATITYNVNKEQEKTVTYTIKNNSRNTKTMYISEEHVSLDIDINISKLQLTLGPGESKPVDFTFKTTKEISSGTYDINLNFFDGIHSITKKVKLLVNPNFGFTVQSLTGNDPYLVIGQNLELILLIKNTGDIGDEFTITTESNNDLRTRTPINTVYVSPHSSALVTVFVSAGEDTALGLSRTYIKIRGRDSGFYNEQFYNITVVRNMAIINLELMSYPTEITIDQNTTKNFEITLRNTGTSTLVLSKIELTSVPQEVVLIVERDIALNPGQTKTITGRLNIGNIPKESINAKLRFISSNGGVLEKPVLLKFQDATQQGTIEKTKLTGFLTLRNSIFAGIIVLCLLTIILYATGVIKVKKI